MDDTEGFLLDEQSLQLLLEELQQRNEADQNEISRQMDDIWGVAFTLLRRSYLLAQLVGEICYEVSTSGHRAEKCKIVSACIPGSTCDHIVAIEVLYGLLARICMASRQIDAAIGAGYYIEACSLLRAVHEALVLAATIEKGDTAALAVGYYELATVKKHRYIRERRKWQESPIWRLPSTVDVERHGENTDCSEEMRCTICTRVIAKYSDKRLLGDYEWARSVLKDDKRGSVKLADLEKSVDMPHRQPLYKILSDATHMSPFGVIEDWLIQVESGNGFVPTARSTGLSLRYVPDVLLATVSILSDITSVIIRHFETVNPGAVAQPLQQLMDEYVKGIEVACTKTFELADEVFDA